MSVFTAPVARARRRVGIARPLQVALGATALLTVAACGGGSSDSATDGSSTAAASGGLNTVSSSFGTILTDGAGKTIYSFAADEKGKSHCEGSCLTYWPPVTVKSVPKEPSGVTAQLGVITRPDDGTKQLTVDGWPMYTYVGDSDSGDTNGQGLNESGGLWWVIGTDGAWIKDTAGSAATSNPTTSDSSQLGGY